MRFINALVASAVIAITSSSVLAQSTAVQWTTASGGNGHWYGSVGTQACWESARVACELEGGHLATPTSESESSFIRALVPSSENGAWLGGIQAPGSCEPACGWSFITGERWVALWAPGQPENGNGTATQRTLTATQFGIHDGWDCDAPMIGIIEWSADCNSDGIVDYGQCLNGTLPDYNGNNIPDCCEQGVACVAGSYPVCWRIEDGGNGHWYRFIPVNLIGSWSSANEAAGQVGGHLATITAPAELGFVEVLSACVGCPGWGPSWAIGGIQNQASPTYAEPTGGWQWVTGENWSWSPWTHGEPNNSGGSEDFLYLHCLRGFNDGGDSSNGCVAAIIEWSADCNADGIVDYGQILSGQLIDANSNGIPDICDVDPCPGDISGNGAVDGVDLSVLLGVWGTDGSGGEFDADVTNDGIVNGADLTIILGGWGPCPN